MSSKKAKAPAQATLIRLPRRKRPGRHKKRIKARNQTFFTNGVNR
jgi:hypothetical protein